MMHITMMCCSRYYYEVMISLKSGCIVNVKPVISIKQEKQLAINPVGGTFDYPSSLPGGGC